MLYFHPYIISHPMADESSSVVPNASKTRSSLGRLSPVKVLENPRRIQWTENSPMLRLSVFMSMYKEREKKRWELSNLCLLFWCKSWEWADLAPTLCQSSEGEKGQRLHTIPVRVQELHFSVYEGYKVKSQKWDRDTAVKTASEELFPRLLQTKLKGNWIEWHIIY